jgi:hypothetical protein
MSGDLKSKVTNNFNNNVHIQCFHVV